jgi:Amt family ammonium transporter
VVVVGVGAFVVTFILMHIVKAIFGLRPSAEDEETGLDLVLHGESGYNL